MANKALVILENGQYKELMSDSVIADALAAGKLISSAAVKLTVKAVMFTDLTTPTNFPLPFIPVGGYTFQEGDRLFYDGSDFGNPGVYTAGDSGIYSFHDNGNSTGTLTRTVDAALGSVIEKGTIFHTEFNDDPFGTNSWIEINTTVTVGAGDIFPSGYNYVPTVDKISSSGTHKKIVSAFVTTNTPLTGVAPGTILGGLATSDFESYFLGGQTDPTENGVYVYHAGSQHFTRRNDFSLGIQIPYGTLIQVGEGTFQSKIIQLDDFIVGQASGPIFPHDVISDSQNDYNRSQTVPVGSGQNNVSVVYNSPVLDNNYSLQITWENTSDPTPQFRSFIITARDQNGFTIKWADPTDSANYLINYKVSGNF